MKNNDYINSVLKHIKNKKAKTVVENELFDHMDEKEKWFMDIGYDEEQSYIKTEESMGDADIIGEQLADLSPKSKKASVIFSLLLIIPIIAVFIYERNIMNLKGNSIIYFGFSSLVFVLSVLCFHSGIKRKSIFGMVSGYIYTAFVFDILYYGRYAVMFIYAFKSKARNFFYYSGYEGYYAYPTIKAVIIAVEIIFIAIFLIGLIVTIKTKRLCNRRYDLKLINFASAFTLTLAIVLAVTFSAITIDTITHYQAEKDKVYEELLSLDKKLIDNIDYLSVDSEDEFYSRAKELFGENIGDSKSYASFYMPDENPKIELMDSSSPIFVYDKTIDVGKTINNIYRIIDNYDELYSTEDVNDIDISSIKTIDDMPLPAKITFNHYDIDRRILFIYDNYNKSSLFTYDCNDFEFKYNPDIKEYELYSTSMAEYEKIDALTEEQTKAFSELINNDVLFDINNFYVYFEINSVGYNAQLDLYKIEVYYTTYEYIDGEIIVDEDNIPGRSCYVIKFEDGEAKQVSYLFDEISSLKDIYNYYINILNDPKVITKDEIVKFHLENII